jgi:hypothetical protein
MFIEHQVVQTRVCIMRFSSAMPAKSRGTVINVWAPGVYEVEFPTYGVNSDGVEGRPVIETLYENELEPCTEAL